MLKIFTPHSPYTKRARLLAVLWTLLILIGCFTPAKEIPKVDVPLADKWVHFILFGGFTFLWLCARPIIRPANLIFLFFVAVAFGSLIEYFQGVLVFLGRSSELLDAVADSIGGLLGISVFCVMAAVAKKNLT